MWQVFLDLLISSFLPGRRTLRRASLNYQEHLGYVMMVLLIGDSEFHIDIHEDLDWYSNIGLDLSELFKVKDFSQIFILECTIPS